MAENTVNGNKRSNIIITGATDDTINAGGGNDIVISGAGDDTINGGRGNDIIISGSGDDIINGGSGSDILISGVGDDTVNGGSGNDLIISGAGNDVVNGGSGNDTIYSGSGDDTVSGGSGHDYINTGSGNDTASGDGGNDLIVTGSGEDTASGNGGHDIIITGTGDDTIYGNAGNDIILSGEGNDTVDGGEGHDVILSGDGNDTVAGGAGDDLIIAGYGEDTIDGGDGYDWIHAGADNDIITAGAGNDYVDGGTGNDIAVFAGNSSDYTISLIGTDKYEVTNTSSGEVDIVKNVETFRFDDGDIDPSNPNVNNDPTAVNDTVSTDEDTAVNINVLANDSDVDGDALTVVSATATNGSVTINADGTLDYTPNANFNGTDTITYEISDGNGGLASANVEVTVNAVNDGPVAVNDAVTTDEDTAVNIDVLANDSDVDGDALTVVSATATNGSVTINADGTLDYTPNANFNGTDTITYEISDGNGGLASATVEVTVNAVNDGPVAVNDAVTTDEDTAVNINVLANDSDVDGDALTVVSATATNGSVTINADGTLDYTPNANFNGTDTITYEISDGNGGLASATVEVTVNAVNDGPVAVNDAVTTDEDTAVNIDVLANDSDVDGDALTVVSATATNGSVTINADGTLDYTPNANFNGTDTITYEISDGNGGLASATVEVTVNAVNDGPVAVNDAVTTDEDTAVNINVLANDSDVDGDALTVVSATATNGSVTINADGTLDYTPNANFNGTDTITYEISDGNGGLASASVEVTVNAVNDGPVAVNDAVTTDEDTAVNINVLANDSDVDGDALTVVSATATNGSITINADGTLDYTPNANFNGTDTITYEISDGNGGLASATVEVTVNAVNDGPVAVNDAVTTDEDTAVNINVLANDSDVDGDVLTVVSATATNGSVTINADGTLDYTPNANFNGTDTITYEISDGNGGLASATVEVTVNAVNDGPVAVNDAVTTDEDTAVNIDVLANDSDVDGDALTVVSATATNGSVTINADGTLDYTPNANFNGTDTITYEISDGSGGLASATVEVTVNAVNDGPVAVNDAVTTDEDTAVNINVLANDSDVDGDALTVVSATATNGSVTINADGTLDYTPNANFNGTDTITYEISDGNGGLASATVEVTVNAVNDGPIAVNDAVTTDEDTAVNINVLANDSDVDGDALTVVSATATNGSITINADGTLDYTPNANFNGMDTITYEISDGNGGLASATVEVTVNAVNDGPVAVNDAVTTDEDTVVTVDVLANDSDVDGDALTVVSATATNGSVTINADGTLDYTPNANFNGTDTITYEISDGNGGLASATVEVTVNAINDGPVAVNDAVTTDEDTAVTIDVLTNDSDVDGDALTVVSATATNGSVTINADGTLDYTPNANFNGTDTITYEISDGNGGLASATVEVTVNAINDGPVAVNDAVTTDEDTAVTIDVLTNDSDVDGDALTVVSATATNGSVTINADGTLDYTPNANFNGTDTITYEISDGNGGLASATVEVTVNAVNDGPVAVNDAITTDEDTAVNIDVLANDSDVDGDAITVVSATATNGSVTINADGTLDYTPNANFNGTDTITYEISDGNGGLASATVEVTVNAINDGPVAVNDAVTIDEDTAVTIDVLTNDSDVDGDALTVVSATATNGSVTINADGTLDYTPNANFNGTDTITYEISDGNGGLASATVEVTVNAVNDGPVAVNDAVTTDEDTAVNIDVLANDSDVDGDALTVVSATATNGSVTINADGSLDYTPNANFSGSDVITYQVNDGNGGTASATVDVTVNAVNQNPVAVDETVSAFEDSVITLNVLANDFDVDGDTLSVVGASASNGSVTVNANGTLSYLANPDFNGVDTITYEISDGKGGTDIATVTVTVEAVNDDPNALDDVASTNVDTAVTIDVLANDTDVDGDALSVSAASALNGSVSINANGTLEYTPNSGFDGNDIITYEVVDGNGGVSIASVEVSVNNSPTALNDTATVDQNGTVNIDVLANDSDIDGDTLSVTSASAFNGTVVINADGTLDYTPANNFSGSDTITYQIDDGNGGTATATVSVTVNSTNDNPVANDDSANTVEDTAVTIDVLSNDSDLNGDTLSVVSVTAINGSVTINADGTLEYVPDANFNGPDTITYEISDGNGGTASATVSVDVSPVNDGPIAVNDSVSTDPDTAVNINVLANDTDVDGDTLTITTATATNGSVTINADGTLDYVPNAGFFGTDSITYEIADGNGGTSSATAFVSIANPSNVAPTAVDDSSTTDEDTSVVIDVLSNDTDPNGDALNVISANAGNGSVEINNDGTLTYTPGSNFNGADSISYTISDGQGGFDNAVVTVVINSVNDGPIALGDISSTDENTSVTISPLANDTDADGDVLTITSATATNGSVVINADGTIDYTPNAGFTGVDSISYDIADGQGGTASAFISVTVNASNDNPIAVNDNATTDEDTPVTIDVLSNDSDADGDTLSINFATADNGLVAINADGSLEYTPATNFNGVDFITYEIADGNGGTATATVSVTVNAVNDGPVAQDDTFETPVNGAITLDVLSNDSDVDGDALTVVNASASNGTVSINADGTLLYTPNTDFNGTDIVTYEISDGQGGLSSATATISVNGAPVANNDTAVTDEDTPVTIDVLANDTDPDGSSLIVTSATAANGTIELNLDGTVTYTPNSNFFGEDTVTYTISDGNGGSSSAEVVVTVNPINNAPNAVDDIAATNQGEQVTIDVLSNDIDLDGDLLTINTAVALNGSVTVNPDNTITYTPDANFNGVDSIFYEVSDGRGGLSQASVSVTVNTGPVAENDFVTVDAGSNGSITSIIFDAENGAIDRNWLANDFDGEGQALSIIAVDGQNLVNGSITLTGSNGGVFTVNEDGSAEFDASTGFETLALGETATTQVVYTVSDGNGGIATATAQVTVNGVNDAVTSQDDFVVSDEDSSIAIDILANDSALVQGDTVTVSAVDGTSANVGTSIAGSNGGLFTINADGTATFDANGDFEQLTTGESVNTSVTYTIEGFGGETSTSTVTVQVDGINDNPVAGDNFATVDAGENEVITNLIFVFPVGQVDQNLLANDTDAENQTLTLTQVNGQDLVNGTITIAGSNGGLFTIQSDGSASFDASTGFETLALGETTTTEVEYTVSDGNGGSATATVQVTVNGLNDAVVSADDQATTDEDTSIALDILSNDIAVIPGDTITVSEVDGLAANVGTSVVGSNGGLFTINADGTASFDVNGDFEQLTTGESVTTSITYTIAGFGGETSTSTVTVQVNGINDNPVAGDNFATLDAGQNQVITNLIFVIPEGLVDQNLLANDTDAESQPLSIVEVNGQSLVNGAITIAGSNGGLFTINSDGSASFDASTGFEALALGESTTSEVVYTVSDGNGGSATATVQVTINGLNDAVASVDDLITTDEDAGVSALDVLANDSALISGDTITVSAVDGDAVNVGTSIVGSNGGLFIINADGTASFDTNGDFDQLTTGENLSTSVTYTIEGFGGETSTSTVTAQVTGINDNPDAVDNFATLNAGQNQVITTPIFDLENGVIDRNLLANDSDAENQTLTITEVDGQNLVNGSITIAGSNGGLFTINADGTASFDASTGFETLAPGSSRVSEVVYTVSDGNGGTSTASVQVTVNGPNEAPVAVADTASVDEDNSVIIDVLANDSDPDGQALIVTNATALNGTVTINADDTVTYTPNSDFNGTDLITYEVSDGQLTAESTVTVTVNPANDAPIAVDDLINVASNGATTIDVLANDIDVDGDSLTVTSAVATNGTVTINANGTLNYTPNAGASGLDTIVYEIADGSGQSSSATATINRLPIAQNDFVATAVDTAVTIDVLSNDSDPEGSSLTIVDATAVNGTVNINADGTLEYIPDAGFNGFEAISYSVADADGGVSTATANVAVGDTGNALPVAQDDFATVNAGTDSVITTPIFVFPDGIVDRNLLANDSDPDGQALTLTQVNGQNLVNGTITVTGSNGGLFTINADGSASFDSSTGFEALAVGESTTTDVSYTVTDGVGGFATATVQVTVNGQNDAVESQDDQVTTDEDSSIAIDILANDTAFVPGDVITVSAVDGNAANVGAGAVGSNGGLFTINADGTASFDANGDFDQLTTGETATTSITYTIVGFGGETSTSTVTVEVTGINDDPVAGDNFATVSEGANQVITNLIFVFPTGLVDQNLLANDTDAENQTLTITQVNGQDLVNGTITIEGSNGGFFTIDSDGAASFDATTGFDSLAAGESTTTNVVYTVSDGNGGSATATVQVTVNGVNDAPDAVDDIASTGEQVSITIDILANDVDVDGNPITISSIDTSNLTGQIVDNGDGTITYDANGQFDALNDGETATDWFEYTISDGAGGFDTAQVQLIILGSTSNSASSAPSMPPPSGDSGSNAVPPEEAI